MTTCNDDLATFVAARGGAAVRPVPRLPGVPDLLRWRLHGRWHLRAGGGGGAGVRHRGLRPRADLRRRGPHLRRLSVTAVRIVLAVLAITAITSGGREVAAAPSKELVFEGTVVAITMIRHDLTPWL